MWGRIAAAWAAIVASGAMALDVVARRRARGGRSGQVARRHGGPDRIGQTRDGRLPGRQARGGPAGAWRIGSTEPSGTRRQGLNWRRHARAIGADVVALPYVDTGSMSPVGKLTPHDLARYSYVLKRVSGSLLDVGCGHGLFLDAYVHDEKAGVDVVRVGRHAWPLHEADAGALPFPDAAWDTVSAQEMLEHQPDAKVPAVLAELRRVARQRLLVTVPFCERRLKSGHLQRFDADRILDLFPTGRFTILDRRTTGYPWVLIEEAIAARTPAPTVALARR